MAGLLGPTTALSLGGLVPIAVAAGYAPRGERVRRYRVPQARG